MAVKVLLVLCAQAFLSQCVYGQCFARGVSAPCGRVTSRLFEKVAPSCGSTLAGVAPASGGALPTASGSSILPNGLALASENAIDGTLAVAGELPFVSVVALEGTLPSVGAGTVSYSCGDGTIGMLSTSGGLLTPRDTNFGQYLGHNAANNLGLSAPCNRAARVFNARTASDFLMAGRACGVTPAVEIATTIGGCLPVASTSPIVPTGVSVTSENGIDGILGVAGDVPFVSAVALEGLLPTAGAGTVSYGCGDGAIGIASVGVAPALGLAGPNSGRIGTGLGLAAPSRGLSTLGRGSCRSFI